MKKVTVISVTLMLMILAACLDGTAQSNQEAFIGYTVGYGPVRPRPSPSDLEGSVIGTLEDDKAFTHGVTASYNYYFHRSKEVKANKLGVIVDLNVQFHDGRASTATFTGGLSYKARGDKKVQPFVHVMAGAARLGFKQNLTTPFGLVSTSRYSDVYVAGAGFDVAKASSRIKWRVRVDYVIVPLPDHNQQFVRATTGLVF